MRLPLFIGIILLAGCVSTEERKLDCAIGQPSANWVQFYPSQEKSAKYKGAILAADSLFDPARTTYWYQSQEGDVFACALMYPYREQKNTLVVASQANT